MLRANYHFVCSAGWCSTTPYTWHYTSLPNPRLQRVHCPNLIKYTKNPSRPELKLLHSPVSVASATTTFILNAVHSHIVSRKSNLPILSKTDTPSLHYPVPLSSRFFPILFMACYQRPHHHPLCTYLYSSTSCTKTFHQSPKSLKIRREGHKYLKTTQGPCSSSQQ